MEPQIRKLGKGIDCSCHVFSKPFGCAQQHSQGTCQVKYIEAPYAIHMMVLEQTHWQLTALAYH